MDNEFILPWQGTAGANSTTAAAFEQNVEKLWATKDKFCGKKHQVLTFANPTTQSSVRSHAGVKGQFSFRFSKYYKKKHEREKIANIKRRVFISPHLHHNCPKKAAIPATLVLSSEMMLLGGAHINLLAIQENATASTVERVKPRLWLQSGLS